MSGHWLGNPTGPVGMVQLPEADPGWSSPLDAHITATPLIGGGVATTRRLSVHRTVDPLTFTGAGPAELAVISGFYASAYGPGPYALVDPSWDNLLGLDASTCGQRRGVLTDWTPTAGTVVYDPSVVSPVEPCGVIRWAGAPNGASLANCTGWTNTPTPDVMSACPYVPEPFTVSWMVRAAAGTVSVQPYVVGRDAGQVVYTFVAGAAVSVGTTWTQITVTAAPGFAPGAQFVLSMLVCRTATAPDILLSAPMLHVGTVTPDVWSPGFGVPRCAVVGNMEGTVLGAGRRTVVLHLAEVA